MGKLYLFFGKSRLTFRKRNVIFYPAENRWNPRVCHCRRCVTGTLGRTTGRAGIGPAKLKCSCERSFIVTGAYVQKQDWETVSVRMFEKVWLVTLIIGSLFLISSCGKQKDQAKEIIHGGVLFDNVIDDQQKNMMTQWNKDKRSYQYNLLQGGGYQEETAHYILRYQPYGSVSALVVGLATGKLDCVYLPECAVKYLIRIKKEFDSIPDAWSQYYQMVLPLKSLEMRDKINLVLRDMRQDRTLENLITEHIRLATDLPKPVKMPILQDAPVLKVGITGALPPMDYMTAGGEPAGFNVALLGEIGKRLNLNIELVPVEINAWPMAMKSGKIDVMFWLSNYNEPLKDSEDLLFSKEFFYSPCAYLTKSEFKDHEFWKEYFEPRPSN